MARIKAKPMNRLPIAPVAGVPMKNGFRSTPPPTVFDPATAFTAQQRFIYPNGAATIPPNVPPPPFAGGQVHMIVSVIEQKIAT